MTTNVKTRTFAEALGKHGVTIPDHLEAQAEVPVIGLEPGKTAWRQGDVYMRLEQHTPIGAGVPARSVKVVEGDADRNSHILDCPNGRWHPGTYVHPVADYGLVAVPAGEVAYLTHTSEHGSIGLAGGETGATYRLWSQVEFAAELRRAAD